MISINYLSLSIRWRPCSFHAVNLASEIDFFNPFPDSCFQLCVKKSHCCCFCCSVVSSVWPFATPWTTACQAPLSFPVSKVCSNSCPLSLWYYLTILFSVALISFCLQSFWESGSSSWPIVSSSYASPFTTTRLWSKKCLFVISRYYYW